MALKTPFNPKAINPPSLMDKINGVLSPFLKTVEQIPDYAIPLQKVVQPFDISVTTTAQPVISTIMYKRIYYLVISVKSMSTTTNKIYLSFAGGATNIELTNYFSYYEFSAPENGSLDLGGLTVACDAGTATVNVSGVAY